MTFIPLPAHTEYFELEMRFPKGQYTASDIQTKALNLPSMGDSRFLLSLMSFTLPGKESGDFVLQFLLIAAWRSARKAPSAFEKFLRSVRRNFTKNITLLKIDADELVKYNSHRVELAQLIASKCSGLSSGRDTFEDLMFADEPLGGIGFYDGFYAPAERWVLKTKKDVLRELAKLRGFPEFKRGLRELAVYGVNAKKRNARSCMNTVLIKNCSVDTTPLFLLMYDFLFTHNLLQEYVLERGHIKDVKKGSNSYVNMYVARNHWDTEEEDMFF